MGKRPSIFDYAKKELSQDAMICWLLDCCHSDDSTYMNIGLDFIKFILEDESINESDIELEKDSPHAQYHRMDVYASIRVGNEIIPVIFEDKTNTFLHGDQEARYTEMVNSWKNNEKWTKGLFDNDKLKWSKKTMYVFFKTGYVFDWQKEEMKCIKEKLNAKVKTIYIDDMLEFIARHKHKDFLLADYYEYLTKRKSELVGSMEDKCNRYFNKIFGDKKRFSYHYQQWAARNFGYIQDESQKGENTIYCAVRTGWRKNAYSIAVQQYRNEKTLFGNNEEQKLLVEKRYVITDETIDICKKVAVDLADDLGVEINFENNIKNKMPSQRNLFRVFIDDDNEEKVCSFFREFIKKFNKLSKDKYKEQYVVC